VTRRVTRLPSPAPIEVLEHDGLRFEVVDRGPPGGPVVVLLHGFPSGTDCWSELATLLASAGYRSVALEQRGYSHDARPKGVDSYRIDRLAGDASALIAGLGPAPVHVLGHDWGAVVGWHLAGHRRPGVASLVALSTPHPAALAGAVLRSSQGFRSLYAVGFQVPTLPEWTLLARHCGLLRASLRTSGLSASWVDRYTDAMLQPGRLTAALNWYRAAGRSAWRRRFAAPDVGLPTTFVFGSEDFSVTDTAVELCARHVSGPYRSHVLDGCTHWLPEQHVPTLWPFLLEHLERHTPAS
jgi:pimeloyl-ACP methyl ester carboxylesterase